MSDFGKVVEGSGAPSYEEALRLLGEADYLLNRKVGPGSKRRMEEVKKLLAKANSYKVWTHNMLNPSGGVFPIPVRDFGTFMDPSTERYHTM